MRVYWDERYVAAGCAFDTTRKSRDVARSLIDRPIHGVELMSPMAATWADLRRAHTVDYLNAVKDGWDRELAASSGLDWDAGTWEMATASTGGVICALQHALGSSENAGSLSSGLHHARADSGAGWCTVNGLAVAALWAASTGKRTLIVDLDAHNGGGTQSIIEDNPRIAHINVSTNDYDAFDTDRDCDVNAIVRKSYRYLGVVAAALGSVNPSDWDCVLYNAGMDVHPDCGAGGLHGLTTAMITEREALVFDWARRCGLPVAFVLAGGYTSARMSSTRLTSLHRATIGAAAYVPHTSV